MGATGERANNTAALQVTHCLVIAVEIDKLPGTELLLVGMLEAGAVAVRIEVSGTCPTAVLLNCSKA